MKDKKGKKDNLDIADQSASVSPADSRPCDASRADRWQVFSAIELSTILGALSDSGSMRSDWAWYLRCSALHTEIVIGLNVDTATTQCPTESPDPLEALKVKKGDQE